MDNLTLNRLSIQVDILDALCVRICDKHVLEYLAHI